MANRVLHVMVGDESECQSPSFLKIKEVAKGHVEVKIILQNANKPHIKCINISQNDAVVVLGEKAAQPFYDLGWYSLDETYDSIVGKTVMSNNGTNIRYIFVKPFTLPKGTKYFPTMRSSAIEDFIKCIQAIVDSIEDLVD